MNQIVLVEWLDAQDAKETWVDTEEAEKWTDVHCKVYSIGFLIRKTTKYLTLGSDWDPDDQNYGTVRKIPCDSIVSIQEVAHPGSSQTTNKVKETP